MSTATMHEQRERELLMRSPGQTAVAALLEAQIPGTSRAIADLRERLLEFCTNPTARNLLILGPIGTGKSTIARLVAFGKRVAPLQPAEADRRVRGLRFEGPGLIDARVMGWFVELTVTGLVDSMVSAQLFGVAPRAATGVSERLGIFDLARTGRGGDPQEGSGVTGGVVFLDEIADISSDIQSRLLPVLAGAPYYRVGGEGRSQYESTFEGVTIAATWRNPTDAIIRQDLLSRFTTNIVVVPSLRDRQQDLAPIIGGLEASVRHRFQAKVNQMMIQDPAVDRAFWNDRLGAIVPLAAPQVAELASVDWSQHGEMRGLTGVVEQVVLSRKSVAEILPTLPRLGTDVDREDRDPVSRLLTLPAAPGGLASQVRVLESEQRQRITRRLLEDGSMVQRLAERMGIGPDALRKQARDLVRVRRASEVDHG